MHSSHFHRCIWIMLCTLRVIFFEPWRIIKFSRTRISSNNTLHAPFTMQSRPVYRYGKPKLAGRENQCTTAPYCRICLTQFTSKPCRFHTAKAEILDLHLLLDSHFVIFEQNNLQPTGTFCKLDGSVNDLAHLVHTKGHRVNLNKYSSQK